MDYKLGLGASDEWATGFVGSRVVSALRVLGLKPTQFKFVRTAVNFLISQFRSGWGYSGRVLPDADSVANAAIFFHYIGITKYHDDIVKFIYSHMQPDGGVSTYTKKDIEEVQKIDDLLFPKNKPGALRNSLALKSLPELKSIYDRHFTANPRKFIELMIENKEKSIEELIHVFKSYDLFSDNVIPIDSLPSQELINKKARQQIGKYNNLCVAINRGVQDGN